MMKTKKFQIGWAIWTLILGISLLFFHTFQYVSSFTEYLKAFAVFDMPSSWCPTFLTLYGTTSLIANLLSSISSKKVFTYISRFAGLVLLPVGLYATYEFTFNSMGEPLPIYIYAQTIHISEILTGLYSIYLLRQK